MVMRETDWLTRRRGGDINGLATDGALGPDAGGVLTGTGVDDGIDENLDRVLVGEEVDDLECVRDDPDGEELLAIVAPLHHQAMRIENRVAMLGLEISCNTERERGRTCQRDARQWASAPS